MDLQHRKSDIALQMANFTIEQLVHNLAVRNQENDELRAKVKELEEKLSPRPDAPQDAQKQP